MGIKNIKQNVINQFTDFSASGGSLTSFSIIAFEKVEL